MKARRAYVIYTMDFWRGFDSNGVRLTGSGETFWCSFFGSPDEPPVHLVQRTAVRRLRYDWCGERMKILKRVLINILQFLLFKWKSSSFDGKVILGRDRHRLLNRPEREWLPCFEAGILVINKIKPTVAIRNDVRFIFSEAQAIGGAFIVFGSDSNGYEKLIAKPVDSQDFCENRDHFHHFLLLTSPETDQFCL